MTDPEDEDGTIQALDGDASREVVIETPSREWRGAPDEFYELKGALKAIEFGEDDADETDEKEIDAVYDDRNLLACALVESVGEDVMGGWTPAPDTDSDEWAIVWLELPVGQVSWHVPQALAERLVTRNDDYDWDGHTREEKNERLAEWATDGCPF